MTALHFAALAGHTDTVRFLLRQGANIDAICHRRMTPLAYARSEGHEEVIQLLLGNYEGIEKEIAGICSVCWRQVYDFSMSKTERLIRSGRTDMIQTIASLCPTCNAIYCAECAHKSNAKCPKCGVAVVSNLYR